MRRSCDQLKTLAVRALRRPAVRGFSTDSAPLDLWDTVRPIYGRLYVAIDVGAMDASVFFGKYSSPLFKTVAGLHDVALADRKIVAARRKVASLLLENGSQASNNFNKIARSIGKHLEDAYFKGSSRFHLPSHLWLIGENSPHHSLYSEGLRRMFSVSRNALRGTRENFSGLGISGLKGTGKTTLLRTLAILGGLLLPNAQTLFVDLYEIKNAREEDMSLICAHLQCSLDAVGLPKFDSNRFIPREVHRAASRGCATFMMIDELPEWYIREREDEWKDLNSFVTSTQPTFAFTTGSSSVLPAIVRNSDSLAISAQRKEYLGTFPSLNDTKLRIRYVRPFSSVDHYRTYFSNSSRGSIDDLRTIEWAGIEDATDESVFARMHLMTGGNLRNIREYLEGRDRESELQNIRNVELRLSPELRRLHRLMARELNRMPIKMIDWFNTISIDRTRMLQLVAEVIGDEDPERDQSYTKLMKWCEEEKLSSCEENYGFAHPLHLLFAERPVAFISHRMAESDNSKAFRTLVEIVEKQAPRDADVVVCEQPNSHAFMKNDLVRWIEAQSFLDSPLSRAGETFGLPAWLGNNLARSAIVLATKAYARYIAMDGPEKNGCYLEMDALAKYLDGEVCLVYDGDEDVSIGDLCYLMSRGDTALEKKLQRKYWHNIRDESDVNMMVEHHIHRRA